MKLPEILTLEGTHKPLDIQFHGLTIKAFQDKGVIWVWVKSMTDAMNAHYSTQHDRIAEDPLVCSGCRRVRLEGKRGRASLVMDCRKIPIWAAGVSTHKSNRSLLLKFRDELDQILQHHFFGDNAMPPLYASNVQPEPSHVITMPDETPQQQLTSLELLLSVTEQQAVVFKSQYELADKQVEIVKHQIITDRKVDRNTEKIDHVVNHIMTVEGTNRENLMALQDTKRKMEYMPLPAPPSTQSIRAYINEHIRKFARLQAGALVAPDYPRYWGEAYRQYYYREHVNVGTRAKNAGMKKMDWLEANPFHLEKFCALILEVFPLDDLIPPQQFN